MVAGKKSGTPPVKKAVGFGAFFSPKKAKTTTEGLGALAAPSSKPAAPTSPISTSAELKSSTLPLGDLLDGPSKRLNTPAADFAKKRLDMKQVRRSESRSDEARRHD